MNTKFLLLCFHIFWLLWLRFLALRGSESARSEWICQQISYKHLQRWPKVMGYAESGYKYKIKPGTFHHWQYYKIKRIWLIPFSTVHVKNTTAAISFPNRTTFQTNKQTISTRTTVYSYCNEHLKFNMSKTLANTN